MNRQQLLSSSLLIALLAGYWLLLGRHELDRIADLEARIQSLHATQLEYEEHAASFEQVRERLDEVSSWLESVKALYVVDEAEPDFLLDVVTTLRSCGLRPRETSPNPVEPSDPFLQQRIHVALEGGLVQVFDFVQRMEQIRPFCRVTDMRLQASPAAGEIRADMTMLRLWREG